MLQGQEMSWRGRAPGGHRHKKMLSLENIVLFLRNISYRHPMGSEFCSRSAGIDNEAISFCQRRVTKEFVQMSQFSTQTKSFEVFSSQRSEKNGVPPDAAFRSKSCP